MKCPFCGNLESKVVDSRPSDEGASIRRRRECLECHKRFTTYETMESCPWWSSRRTAAVRPSTGTSCWAVCSRPVKKRSVPLADLERMAGEIEQALQTIWTRRSARR